MGTQYKVRVDVRKYRDTGRRYLWGCEVWESYYQEDTLVKLRPNFSLIADMQAWSESQGGRHVGFNLYEFTNQEAATMFVLRWHGT